MADFQRNTFPFDVRSINLSKPVDKLAPNEYRLLENVRPYGPGRCQGRQGTVLVSTSGTTANNAHSIFSFDDPIASPTAFPGAFFPRVRLLGSGTGLLGARDATNPVAFTNIVGAGNPGGQTTFSGNPLSFVVANNDQTPRPWAFIADSNALRKVSSALITWPWGIAPPNFAPTIAVGTANANGPDIGTSPNPYIYALRARTATNVNTGAVSNLGPAVRLVNGLSPSSAPGAGTPPSNITITIPQAHPDPQVRWLDIFRWGGSLPQWLYIGTVNNISGTTITDNNPDSAIASAAQAPLDDNQPFTSVDISREGNCTLTSNGVGLGATLTITAGGDVLRPYNAVGTAPYYPAGTQISVAGLNFTFYSAPNSTTSVQLLEDCPAGGPFNVTFQMNTPEMVAQPLPCVWGPFGGGLTGIFIFACGDPNNGGALYWTKGNNPESHPGTNVLDITSNSEPLMNGCIYNGNSYVFSTKRMFAVYPTLGQTSDFSALEIPNSKGLFARWGICVTPHGICFIGKDGIYLTTGGEPISLSDADLYPIFPQESQGDPAGFPVIDGLTGTAFAPPDFTQPNAMRLAYGDGFLYFTYIDAGGTYRTLVWCFEANDKGWVSRDTYTPQMVSQYFEVVHDETAGGSWQKILMGGTDGNIYQFGGGSDNNVSIAGEIRTGSMDFGDSRPRKLIGDVELDFDAQCDTLTVKAGFDNYSYLSVLSNFGTNTHGRTRDISDINSGSGQYAYNLGLDISWTVSASQPVIYNWTPTVIPKPELTALRVTDWTDDEYPGAKFVQGFVMRVDTLNVQRTFNVLSDGGMVQQSFTVTTSNEQEIAFSFTTPFVSHLLRVAPTDTNFWRILGLRWIWEPLPEDVLVWETQETTYDLPGFHHHRDAYIGHESTADITWTITNDGTATVLTIPNSGGAYRKTYVVLPPMKSKATQHRLVSAEPFRLYVKDSEVRVRAWGGNGPYAIKQPFGEISRTVGARI